MQQLYWFVIFAWAIAQLLKLLIDSFRSRRFRAVSVVRLGGMPSAHSAIVSALVTAVGMNEGVSSTIFIVTAVFSFIVVYDAFAHHRVRRHTLPQVIAGVIVGVSTILIASFLL